MSRAQTASASQARTQLLGRLGLPRRGSGRRPGRPAPPDRRVPRTAPADLKGWAGKRGAEADRIYGLLTGPEAESPNRRHPQGGPGPGPQGLPDVGEVAARHRARGRHRLRGLPDRQAAVRPARDDRRRGRQRPTSTGLDEAKVAELMGKLKDNPQDVAVLFDLGNAYYQADQYQQASEWYQKVLDVNADDEKGLVALGAASSTSATSPRPRRSGTGPPSCTPNNPRSSTTGLPLHDHPAHGRDEGRTGQGRPDRARLRVRQDRAEPRRRREAGDGRGLRAAHPRGHRRANG